ncbi:MAG: carboxypeptidase regulatory-like domain-containing protein [Planctomycetes bacterium]|nr:carboxypeptidase regulatory-like domain-containing protein [Planctomycetota bacterium]
MSRQNLLVSLLLGGALLTGVAAWFATRESGAGVRSPSPVALPAVRDGSSGEPLPGGRDASASGRGGRVAANPALGGTGLSPEGAPGDLAALAPGRIRGRIELARGTASPARYELLVESPGEPTKVFVFPGAERLVTLDLPVGRSVLRARADGLGSRALAVERPGPAAAPGTSGEAPLAPFDLTLEPAGFLGGSVVDSLGAPLAGLPVHLLDRGARAVRSVQTDPAGRYGFEDLPLGSYRVAFGSAESPVAPVVGAEVVPGEVRDVPPQAMPALGEAEVLVRDAAGNPLAGARVAGRGQHGGAFEGATDAGGRIRARFLPAGSLYVDVSGSKGRGASAVLEVEPGRIVTTTLRGD